MKKQNGNTSFEVFNSVASNDKNCEELDSFFDSDHNFVILSNAGKPIYSLNGDIYSLSSVYATLYAMISKVQNYKFKPIDISIQEEKYDDFDERRGPGTFG